MKRIAIAICVLAVALFARADTPVRPRRTQAAGFDHSGHARAVPEVACTRCHPLERGAIAKAPDHATCFVGCHVAYAPLLKLRETIAVPQLGLCNACHAETALVVVPAVPLDKKALAVSAPKTGTDHALQLGHDSHRQIACDKCHDVRGGRRDRPHARCLGCHGDKQDKTFAITACERCHTTGADRPHFDRTDAQIFVTSTYSHTKHARRGTAKLCATCHAAVSATDSRVLPRPTQAMCSTAGCHDGAAAFGVTASCTKCHKDVVPGKLDTIERPGLAFSHARHDVATLPCAACHSLSKTGEVRVANHAACATTGCHPDDFGRRKPVTCNACHDGIEPWRPLVADRLPGESTEFGATLDHGKHPRECASCHSLSTTRTELRPPRGHRACATAGCHAVTGGPAPQLTSCETCHQRGGSDRREATRLAATWSVRSMFTHRAHLSKTACTTCHSDLSAPDLLSLAAPTKATCATCHDGTVAFKVTGTACTKCHPGVTR